MVHFTAILNLEKKQMCTCVAFTVIFTTTHFRRVPKLLLFFFFFLLLTKWLKLQPFPDSLSCRTCNKENIHSASRAGLLGRMTSSLQMCTWSSGSSSSSSQQVFVCLKWHSHLCKHLARARTTPSPDTPTVAQSFPAPATSHSHYV